MKNVKYTARRNVMQYPLIFLGILTVAGCYPAPRYALHETTDPRNGNKITLLLDTTKGQAAYLGGYQTTNGTWLVWRGIDDFNRAYKLDLELRKTEEMLRTNPGTPLDIY
jgi:hypothetical protein